MPPVCLSGTHSMAKKPITAAIFWLAASYGLFGQMVELAGIAHVAFRVANLEKSREFYERLGFEEAFKFADAGTVTQEFIKINDRQFIELYARTETSQTIGWMHICFEVADINSLRAGYVDLGLNPTEVKKFRAGNLLFVIHDPEGQILEYTQYLPGSLHSEDRGKHVGDHRMSDHLQSAAMSVKDLALERAFYVNKLKFIQLRFSKTKLLVPGSSGDEVELRLVTPTARLQVFFSVRNAAQAAHILRGRGLMANLDHDEVAVEDPDGTRIVFRTAREEQMP
jgi:catechol 2,3-dioxygenase-like lactoylglutathione lyase family enzyme